MSAPLILGMYRRLVRLYPRAFRDDYGTDLVDLFAEQLRDEPTWRVGARALIDLALTVRPSTWRPAWTAHPTSSSPTRSARSSPLPSPSASSALMPSSLWRASPWRSLPPAWRWSTPVGPAPLSEPQPVAAHWWKPTAVGAALLITLIVVTTATGELSDAGWLIAMIAGLAALLLLGTGVVLGIVNLANRTTRRPAT